MKKAVWLQLQVLISVGFLFVFSNQAQSQVIEPGTVQYEDTRPLGKKFVMIHIKGTIANPLADNLASEFKKIPVKADLVISLNSAGGSVQEGLRVIELIKKEKENRKIGTVVFNGEICASMCVPIYMQGTTRTAAEVSGFMFHGAAMNGFTNIPNPQVSRQIIEYMIRDGASEKWLMSLWKQGVFTEPTEYWMSGKELFEQKTGVVNAVVPRFVKFTPWSAPFDPSMGPK